MVRRKQQSLRLFPSALSVAPTPPSGIPERITSALFRHRLNNSLIYWNQGLKSSSTNLSSPILGLQTSGLLSIFDSALHGGSETVYSHDFSESGNTFRFLKLDDDGNLRIYSSATRNSGPMVPQWSAVADQCLVYGYCRTTIPIQFACGGLCSFKVIKDRTTHILLCFASLFDVS